LLVFDEDDVFKFQKKVLEDDKKKAERIRRMFDQQEKLDKIKVIRCYYIDLITSLGCCNE